MIRDLLTSRAFRPHPHVPMSGEMYVIRDAAKDPNATASKVSGPTLYRHYLGRYTTNPKLVKKQELIPNGMPPELEGTS